MITLNMIGKERRTKKEGRGEEKEKDEGWDSFPALR